MTRVTISKKKIAEVASKYYVNIEESLNGSMVWNIITVYESMNEISAKQVAYKLSYILSLDITELYNT